MKNCQQVNALGRLRLEQSSRSSPDGQSSDVGGNICRFSTADDGKQQGFEGALSAVQCAGECLKVVDS